MGREAEEAAAAKKAHLETVPGMLEAIFEVVDADRNSVLGHAEFVRFVRANKGRVPSPVEYDKMCALHGSPGGLTFDKMLAVYSARSLADLRATYEKVMS